VDDDIVTQLRGWVDRMDLSLLLLAEAADEIEWLRAAGDALAECLRYWADFADTGFPDDDALRTWQEVRRG
jgi:hypothetical protein